MFVYVRIKLEIGRCGHTRDEFARIRLDLNDCLYSVRNVRLRDISFLPGASFLPCRWTSVCVSNGYALYALCAQGDTFSNGAKTYGLKFIAAPCFTCARLAGIGSFYKCEFGYGFGYVFILRANAHGKNRASAGRSSSARPEIPKSRNSEINRVSMVDWIVYRQ
jgi:hypothetical protein